VTAEKRDERPPSTERKTELARQGREGTLSLGMGCGLNPTPQKKKREKI